MNFSRKQNLVNFIQIKFSLLLTNIYFGTYNLISKEISKKIIKNAGFKMYYILQEKKIKNSKSISITKLHLKVL